MEAIKLVCDYENDTQYFAALSSEIYKLHRDEVLLALNYRSMRMQLECVVKGCNMPLWLLNYQLLRGVDRVEQHRFSKLLIEYTCGEHGEIYEAVTLNTAPLYLTDIYGSV